MAMSVMQHTVNCAEEVLKENLRKKERVVVCCVAASCTTEKKRTSAEMNHMSMSKACWQILKTVSPSLVHTDFKQIFLRSTRPLELEQVKVPAQYARVRVSSHGMQ